MFVYTLTTEYVYDGIEELRIWGFDFIYHEKLFIQDEFLEHIHSCLEEVEDFIKNESSNQKLEKYITSYKKEYEIEKTQKKWKYKKFIEDIKSP